MTTAEKRLEAMEAGLPAKERALLWLRAWREDREPDRRIADTCPEKDRAEMDGWTARVSGGQNNVFSELMILQEWTLHLDHALALLVTTRRYEGRIAKLVQALTCEGVDVVVARRAQIRPGRRALELEPLAPVPHGYRRGMKLWAGSLVTPDVTEPPAFAELATHVESDLRQGLVLRLHELKSYEVVLEEVCEEFDGEDVVHVNVREGLADWRAKLVELRAGFEREVGPLEVPPLSEESLDRVRALFPAVPSPALRRAGRR